MANSRSTKPSSTELTAPAPTGLPAEIEALLPDLVKTETEVSGRDINFPRIKISHPNHPFVPDLVPPFALYSDLNQDDDNKVVLFELPKGASKPDFEKVPDAGVLVYIVNMRRGWSANLLNGEVVPRNTPGAEFRSWSYDDPTVPQGADATYTFVAFTPELDAADRPHRFLMTRSSTNTARNINTLLNLAEQKGLPSYVVPFRIWTEKRERTQDGQTQRWGVFKARPVSPEAEFVKTASQLAELVNSLTAEQKRAVVESAGDDTVAASDAAGEPGI
jgi:hypothetical protein